MLEKIAQTRYLSRATSAVRQLVSERGESNAVSMALDVISSYRKLNTDHRSKFFMMLVEQFNINVEQLTKAAQSFALSASCLTHGVARFHGHLMTS